MDGWYGAVMRCISFVVVVYWEFLSLLGVSWPKFGPAPAKRMGSNDDRDHDTARLADLSVSVFSKIKLSIPTRASEHDRARGTDIPRPNHF